MSILSVNRAEYESRLYEILQGLEGGDFTDGNISALRLSAINFVKVKLDELVPEGEGVIYSLSTSPNKTNPIDLFINSHLDESAKGVSLTAPKHTLFPISIIGSGTPTTSGSSTGFIELPVNYLRLFSLKMKDWEHEVNEAFSPESKIGKKQSNIYLRGKTSKPVVIIDWQNVGTGTPTTKRVLRYYSVNNDHNIDKLFYIPSTYTSDYTFDNWVADNPHLIDSVAWMCASKIMQITGQTEAEKFALDQVKQSYINLNL